MKKFVTMVLATIFSASVVAQEIDVIISGKQGGSSYARTMKLAEFLETKGYEVNLIKSFNIRKALRHFEGTKNPTAMAAFDAAWVEAPDAAPLAPEHVGVIEYESPLYICGTPGTDGKSKLSWRADYPASLEGFVGQVMETKIIPIPYDSGGAELEALIAGDTNLMVTSLKRASKAVAAGFECSYTTGPADDTKLGAKTLRTMVDNPLNSLGFTFFTMIKNVDDVDSFRAMLTTHVTDPAYLEYIKGRKSVAFDGASMNDEETFNYLQGAINSWTSK